MSSSLNAPNFIPGDNVADALADLQVAVGADPGLSIISICTDAGLGRVLNTTFSFASTKAESNRT